MKKNIKKIIQHPLISGSAIIFLGTNLGNVFNLFFNFFMLRNLTPADYGVVVSLISIITLFAYIADSFTPSIVNFAAIYFAHNQIGKVKTLFIKIVSFSSLSGLVVLISFIVFSNQVSHFLKISDNLLLTVTGICIFFGFVGIANKAFLQAKLAFTFIAFVALLGAFVKFVSGSFFILEGFGVYGALFAFILSFFIPYLLTLIPLRFLFDNKIKRETIDTAKILSFGLPAFISIFGLISFITVDILLVKHFFDPSNAGLYAGLSVVAKIIFFFSAPIGAVMFPIVVRKHAKNENFHKDFFLALLLILIPSATLTLVYFLFPEFIIQLVMKRTEYLIGAPLLGMFGLFLSIYSVLYVITNFYLSIKKTNVYLPIFFFASLQILGIWFFHTTLFAVLLISILSSGLLLITLLLYYWKVILKADLAKISAKNISIPVINS